MVGHEKTLHFKLLTSVLALTLVFGLSAMPALAAPGDEDANRAATQSEETAASTEESTPAAPATSAPATPSEKTPQAPSGKSWTGGEQAADLSEEDADASKKESLNPAEKMGAILAAEGGRALDNATGNQTSSYDQITTADDPYSDIVGKINEPDFGTYTPGVSSGAKITIKKAFSPAPTIATTESNGTVEAADITVSFKLKAERMDKHGYVVCKDDKDHMLMVNDSGDVFDYHGYQMYWDANNNLVSKTGDGADAVYSDTDGDNEYRDPISKKDGKLATVNDGGYLYENPYYGYRYFFDENKTCIYIDDENYILDGYNGNRVSPEKKIWITTVDPKDFKRCAQSDLGLKPIIVCDRQVDMVVGAEMGARTITDLPYPARYYLEECTYPGCGYELLSVEPASSFVLDESNREFTVTFNNASTASGIPSSGAVNSYSFDYDGDLKAERITDFTSLLDSTN